MAELSFLSTPKIKPLIYKTCHQILLERAREQPNREAYVHRFLDDKRLSITYKQLNNKAIKLAKYLVKIGIKPGDCIGIIGPNSIEWIICEFGMVMAGAIAIHLVICTTDARDIKDICDQSKCCAVLVLHENEVLRNLIEEQLTQEGRIIINLVNGGEKEKVTIKDIIALPEEEIDLPYVFPEDDAFVFTTSGSTGKPKMVVYTHIGIQGLAEYHNPSGESIVIYVDRPFSWAAGFPLTSIVFAEVRVFMTSEIAVDKRNIPQMWKIMQDEGCSFAFLMPYTLKDIDQMSNELNTKDFKLKRVTTGGQIVGDMSVYVGVLCDEIRIGYGSTELPSIASRTVQDSTERGDVGIPFEGTDVKIVNDEGKPVKQGTIGSIQVRSVMGFAGYLGNEDLTNATVSNKGWIKLGDIGKITANGHLVVIGREKDIISRGTRKIIPTFIEEVVLKLTQILLVCVVSVPDVKLGEEICVCFIPNKGENIEPSTVKAFCENKFLQKENSIDGIGSMPKYFLQLDDFPKLTNGKVDKQTLKKHAKQMLGLQ